MSGLIDKLKGSAKPIKEGDKVSDVAVKENDFHAADVHLHNLKGKSMLAQSNIAFNKTNIDNPRRPHPRCARCLHRTLRQPTRLLGRAR